MITAQGTEQGGHLIDYISLPSVSLIMPAFNEENYIALALRAALQQDYPTDKLEILIADGGSTDRTRDIVNEFSRKHGNVKLIDNPQRIVSTGLNRAIAAASGEVIVRFDAHCEYPRDYVRRLIDLKQQSGVDNIGGVLVPIGNNYKQAAVAAAYYSRVGFGGNALKGGNGCNDVREVDTVHGGCWSRARLVSMGGFDEQMVRNQDDELSFRLRKASGRILQVRDLFVRYHVRSSFRKLFLQFFQYGFWKVRVVRKHPRQASIRHFVPAVFVLSIATLVVALPFSRIAAVLIAVLLGCYFVILSMSAILQTWRERKTLWLGVVAALAMMHVGYGTGFLMGLLRLATGFKLATVAERSSR